MTDLSRELVVIADGEKVTGFNHARLTGMDSIGLQPLPFTLRLWNLSDSEYYLLSGAKEIAVKHDDSVLAAGEISDICRGSVPEGTVTEIVFSAGLRLWEAPVSLSVEAGVSVSETVRRILTASGTGIPLLSFPGMDPVRSRGQAFLGRAAECVETALSAAKARACLTPSGMCVIPASGLPVSMELTGEDITDTPSRTGERLLIVRTTVTGWPLGKRVSVSWKGETADGLVVMRSVDADNLEGNWQAELIIDLKL